ncbi:MAG: SDR family oxidoreductase [Gemmataceae bacterium]
MTITLKKLKDQVIVITGASSGIGLATARMAARRGARVVAAARSEHELRQLIAEIEGHGGQAVAVPADVGREGDVRRIAEVAVRRFGGFDTWVNNAGVSIYGKLMEVPPQDHRQLFETNFWGTVYGSLTAAAHLRYRGGAIVNLGSVAGDRALPLQGMYSATKFAVKGFTEALRMELQEQDGANVSVTLIKPASIGTPFPRHARNYLPVEPTLPPPVYAPDLVAEAILYAAEHPERELAVGGASKAISTLGAVAPRLMDQVTGRGMAEQQKTSRPAPRNRLGNLFGPSHDLAERMAVPERTTRETSVYTTAVLHPLATKVALLGLSLAAGAVAYHLTNAVAGERG